MELSIPQIAPHLLAAPTFLNKIPFSQPAPCSQAALHLLSSTPISQPAPHLLSQQPYFPTSNPLSQTAPHFLRQPTFLSQHPALSASTHIFQQYPHFYKSITLSTGTLKTDHHLNLSLIHCVSLIHWVWPYPAIPKGQTYISHNYGLRGLVLPTATPGCCLQKKK